MSTLLDKMPAIPLMIPGGHYLLDPLEVSIFCAFSVENGAVSKLIRDFTGGDVSHAFLLFKSPVLDTWMTLGANANGLTFETLESFSSQIVHIYSAPGLIKGLRYYRDWINREYDYAGLVGMAYVEAQEAIFRHVAKNPMLDAHKLFCSEYVTEICRESDYKVLPDFEPGSVNPNALSVALSTFAGFKSYTLADLTS